MSEHFVIKNIRRSIKEAQSRKGMIVGLPEIRIPACHAEVLLGQIECLTAQLAEARGSPAKQVEAKDKACAALMLKLAEANEKLVGTEQMYTDLYDQHHLLRTQLEKAISLIKKYDGSKAFDEYDSDLPASREWERERLLFLKEVK